MPGQVEACFTPASTTCPCPASRSGPNCAHAQAPNVCGGLVVFCPSTVLANSHRLPPTENQGGILAPESELKEAFECLIAFLKKHLL